MPKPEIQPPTTKTVRDESEHGEWFATTLARGLSLIEAFGPEDTWLGNAELSRRTGLSKPTVSRLSSTLIELGFLTRNDEGKFRPGVRLLALAYPVLRSLTIRLVARPLMLEVGVILFLMRIVALLPPGKHCAGGAVRGSRFPRPCGDGSLDGAKAHHVLTALPNTPVSGRGRGISMLVRAQ